MQKPLNRWFVLTSLSLTACAGEGVTRPPPAPVDWRTLEPRAPIAEGEKRSATQRERGVANAYTKALAAPDFAGLGALLDEHAHFTFAGYHDVHGRQNVVRAHESLLGAFDKRAFETGRVFWTHNAQIVAWTMQAVNHGTQDPVVVDGLTLLWTKDNGAVLDMHVYYDEARVKEQLGGGPKNQVHMTAPRGPIVREDIEQAGSSEESANVALVQQALDALENNQEAAFLATMADDVVMACGDATPHGKAGARAYFQNLRKSIDQLDAQVDDIWGIGSYVVVEYHIVGEQRGPIGRVPAQKDTLIKMFAVDIAAMHDGKIAHVWRYDNPTQILASPTGESP